MSRKNEGPFPVRETDADAQLLRRLEASERRLYQLLDTLPHGVQENDIEGIITFSNRAHCEMHGCREGELVGTSIFDMAPASKREELREYFATLVREQPEPVSYRAQNITRDGRAIEVRVDWNYLRDANGKLVGFSSIVTDVTEQARSDEALLEQQAHLESLKDSAHGFVVYRLRAKNEPPYGEVVLVSPSISDVLGVEAPMDFAHWFANIHPEDRQRVAAANEESSQRGTTFDQIMRVRHPADEDWRWIRAISNPVYDASGQPSYFNGLIVDVTSMKRAEERNRQIEVRMQEAQKLESLGVLAGGIAHDFNNLLMAILGNTDLALEEASASSPVRPYLTDINTISRRAAELTNQLLAYSGKGHFEVRALDLNELIEELTHLMETVISRRIQLRFDLTRPLPSTRADAGQIRQVLMNLLTNASEATAAAGGVVAVRTGVEKVGPDADFSRHLPEPLGEGDYVYLEVADTGLGMDEATRQRMFEPFFTTKGAGRGLGMAAALGIARSHEGALVIDTEPDRGTTVRLLLSSAPPSEPVELQTQKRAATPSGLPGKRILIAEDEPAVRSLLKKFLQAEGVEVIETADGAEAVARFESEAARIDLALLDVTMPKMDGIEAAERILAMHSDFPVLLTSGFTEETASETALERLAGFIQKPFRFADLREALLGALEKTP